MTYQNTGKPNGRPPNTERNQKIIADVKAGIPVEEVAEKYGLALPYTRKIASEHARKERVKKEAEEAQVKASTRLYAERDVRLKKFYASLNRKGAMSMYHIDECNSKYARKAA